MSRPPPRSPRTYPLFPYTTLCRSAVAKLGGCAGDMEAAHTPDPMSKAMGSKASDYNEIPLCHHHHDIQTRKGWSAIGLTREAAQKMSAEYWRAWPGRIAYERQLEGSR